LFRNVRAETWRDARTANFDTESAIRGMTAPAFGM
jgi:hypothetical protein